MDAALYPQAMAEAVVANGAHLGIALDGDADKLIIADEKGTLVDGDQILATLATAMKAEGTLEGDGVVGTVMSNRGLGTYLGNGVDLAPVTRWRSLHPRNNAQDRD